MSSKRRKEILHQDSFEAGILGWTETQEQANIVARQLQRMSQSDRCSAGHMHAGNDEKSVNGIVYIIY